MLEFEDRSGNVGVQSSNIDVRRSAFECRSLKLELEAWSSKCEGRSLKLGAWSSKFEGGSLKFEGRSSKRQARISKVEAWSSKFESGSLKFEARSSKSEGRNSKRCAKLLYHLSIHHVYNLSPIRHKRVYALFISPPISEYPKIECLILMSHPCQVMSPLQRQARQRPMVTIGRLAVTCARIVAALGNGTVHFARSAVTQKCI